MGSLLAGKVITMCGRDTLWSSSTAAYNASFKPLQAFLDGLTAVHDIRKGFTVADVGGDEDGYAQACKYSPAVKHPAVRIHPITGRKLTFLNWGRNFALHQVQSVAVNALH